MKRLAIALLFIASLLPLCAQQPVTPADYKELQAQLAEAKATIAQKDQMILELNIQVRLAQKAALGPELDQARQQADQQVKTATEQAKHARADATAKKAEK